MAADGRVVGPWAGLGQREDLNNARVRPYDTVFYRDRFYGVDAATGAFSYSRTSASSQVFYASADCSGQPYLHDELGGFSPQTVIAFRDAVQAGDERLWVAGNPRQVRIAAYTFVPTGDCQPMSQPTDLAVQPLVAVPTPAPVPAPLIVTMP